MVDQNQYYIERPEDFKAGTVPASKRNFVKAAKLVKDKILAVNKETGSILSKYFGDFKGTVELGEENKTVVKLSLKENANPLLHLNGNVEFKYNNITLADVMEHLGIAASYNESDYEAVKAKLPEELSADYDEATQILTVKALETAAFTFEDESTTSAIALLSLATDARTFKIAFFDDAIDVQKRLPNRDITIVAADLVEPASTPAPEAPASEAAA